jgi:hypothetical protein
LTDILELEFELSKSLGIPLNYDEKEYFEFIWHYERMVQERKEDNERSLKINGVTNILDGF